MSGLLGQIASQLFWATTLLPGFALLIRLDRRNARGGLLPAAALAFTLTAAIVAPLATIAFLCHAPLGAVAAGWAALCIVAIAASWRRGGAWLRSAWRRTPRVPFFLLVAGLAAVAPLGGVVSGDSPVHVAKLRWLLDVGCTLQDPYSAAPLFESRYHVDSWQTLLALGAWFGRRDPLAWWYESAWFARLLAIGGAELLALAILRSRRAAALAAVGAFFTLATIRTIAYPNKFAAFVILPVAVAWSIDWLRAKRARPVAPLAFAGLAMASVHAGFFAIVGLCLLPAAAIVRIAKDRRLTLASAAAIARAGAAYLVPGLPFLLFTALQPNYADAQQGDVTAFLLTTFRLFGRDYTILDPFGPGAMGSAGLAILLLLILREGRRLGDRLAALSWLVAAACMWLPPLFALLTKVMPHWMVMRCGFTMFPFSFALVPGVPAWWLSRRFRTPAARLVLLALVAAGTFLLQRHHWQRFWRTRDSHVVVQSNSAALATLLEGLPPTRPLVASDPTTSTLLPAARHCSVVASLLIHANPADAGLRERHRRLVELLAPATDAVQRGELLRELAPDYLIVPLEPPKRRPTMDEEDDVELTEIAPPSAFETCCERLRTAGPYVLMRPRRELR